MYFIYNLDYPDFYEMKDALLIRKEVEGILADIYTASYYMKKINDSRLVVSMFLASQHSIGFVTGLEKEDLVEKLGCLRNLFKYRQRDIQQIILRHTQEFHVSWCRPGDRFIHPSTSYDCFCFILLSLEAK